MTSKPKHKDFNQPGDLIFVKVRGYPHWPARIDGEVVINCTTQTYKSGVRTYYSRKWPVFFFGTHENALVLESSIFPYDKHKEEFHKERSNDPKRRAVSSSFNLGLWELLNNPGAVHEPLPAKTNKLTAAAAKADKRDGVDVHVAGSKKRTLITIAEKRMDFLPGELIFVKLKGYPHWPARIEGVHVARMWPIFFFGSHENGFAGEKDIFPYDKHKEEFHKERSNNPPFNLGLWEILNNPGAVNKPLLTKTDNAKVGALVGERDEGGHKVQAEGADDEQGEGPRNTFKEVLKDTKKKMSTLKKIKQKHKKYENMKKAIDAVEQGMHINSAGKIYNVCLTTLKKKTVCFRQAARRKRYENREKAITAVEQGMNCNRPGNRYKTVHYQTASRTGSCKRNHQTLHRQEDPPKIGPKRQMQETQKLRKGTTKSLPTKTQDKAQSINPGNCSTENTKEDDMTLFKANLKMYLHTLCKAFLSFESGVELKCNIHLDIDKSKVLEFDVNETISNQKNVNVSNSKETPQNKMNAKTFKTSTKSIYSMNKIKTDKSQYIKPKKMQQKKGSKSLNVKKKQLLQKKQKKSVPFNHAKTRNNTGIRPSIQPSTSFPQSKESSPSYLAQNHPEYHSVNSETYRRVSYSLPNSLQTDDKIYSACEVVIEKFEPDDIEGYEPEDIEGYEPADIGYYEPNDIGGYVPASIGASCLQENQQAVFKIEVNVDQSDNNQYSSDCDEVETVPLLHWTKV